MMFSWIFILAAIVFAAVYFGNGKFRTVKKEKNPALERRSAESETDEEEYEERKAVLGREETHN